MVCLGGNYLQLLGMIEIFNTPAVLWGWVQSVPRMHHCLTGKGMWLVIWQPWRLRGGAAVNIDDWGFGSYLSTALNFIGQSESLATLIELITDNALPLHQWIFSASYSKPEVPDSQNLSVCTHIIRSEVKHLRVQSKGSTMIDSGPFGGPQNSNLYHTNFGIESRIMIGKKG
jgi:hypothetical protein